jgi:SAM-dependent methyltransferase
MEQVVNTRIVSRKVGIGVVITDEHGHRASQQEIWNDLVGDAWVKYADIHDVQAAPFGQAVMNALGDISGERVLDVGCGTGAAAAQLLDRGAAEVLGVDLSVAMVEAARMSARQGVRFEVGDVVELDAPGTFDVVFSRFGVMFFADPTAAFTRLHASSSNKARLGFCCWGPPFDNPVMTLPVMAAAPVLGPPAFPGPGEPGPFSLASPEIIHHVLTGGGWKQVEVGELTLEPAHPAGGAIAVAEMSMEFNPLLVLGLRRAPNKRAAVRDAIVNALLPFERKGVVHLRASALVVSAAHKK